MQWHCDGWPDDGVIGICTQIISKHDEIVILWADKQELSQHPMEQIEQIDHEDVWIGMLC